MKNRNIVIFLLIMFIFMVILYKYFFKVENKTENIRNESENLIKIKQESGEKIQVNAAEYNKKMKESNPFKCLVKIINKNSDNYELTNEQMLSFVTSYAKSEDEEILKENIKEIKEEEPVYIKFSYLNELCKKYFDKSLDKESLQDYLEDDYFYVSLPTNFPNDLYKFNELRYDSSNDIYSLFFDKIDINAKDYNYIENYKTTEFDYNMIEKNYRILYREKGNEKIIIGIEEIKSNEKL